MKKAILLAVLLILGIGTSQAQLLKFGVKGGLNLPTIRVAILKVMILKPSQVIMQVL